VYGVSVSTATQTSRRSSAGSSAARAITACKTATSAASGTPASARHRGGSPLSPVSRTLRRHGPGIDSDQRERIFDWFYQVDQSSTRLVGGVGMGLYICRRAAERLGGSVWLDRSDASGSVFAVRFLIGDNHGRPERADVVRVAAPA
jgi:Histidine kinase-, DNA gyrase B-, and HSP90-like ATPase